MTYKAFVSSTFVDLKDHRAYAIGALRRAGFHVDPMEDWPADSDEPKAFSRARVEGCDLCVLLVALRRGHVPEGETRSITQLEYQAAVDLGMDVLVFMLEEDAPWPRKFDELEKDPEMRRWRNALEEHHGVEPFGLEPASIDMTGALGRWFAKHSAPRGTGGVTERIDWPENKSPYPGLMWFDQEYAPLFYGRDREVDDVIAKMSEPGGRLVIISGASGTGKSSLIGAGVWRALIENGCLPGSRDWVWLRIQPGDGDTPFASLAWGLKQAFPKMAARPDDLAKTLAADRNSLGALLAEQLGRGQELVLFIDQMEEFYTRGFAAEDIGRVLEHLVAIAQDKTHRLRVAATVRSEFLVRLEGSTLVLEKVLNAGYNYHLGLVSPRALQDMIERPAHATGYAFEPSLVDDILRDAGQEPGHLPLVAYALNQLFERRQARQFTRKAYADIHGVAGAIGIQADAVIDRLDPALLGTFDSVFAQLVHVERDGPPTRRRVALRAFESDLAARKLIDALAAGDCRVLVTDQARQVPSVEVAHEKLFTAWPRLQQWIEEAGDALRLIAHATEEAQRWHTRGEKAEERWGADRLAEVEAALQRFGQRPSASLNRFLRPQPVLIARIERETLSHEQRATIGVKLAEFGDTRPGVGLREDDLPEILWSDPIQPGAVEIEDVGLMQVEQPFRIALYPVTNVQFEAFLDAPDGYENNDWWEKLKEMDPRPPSWPYANHPRETVSWYQAVAFCRWLTAKYRERGLLKAHATIRLPTEWEWQQAATGGDASNAYPWGPEWDASRCNSAESRINRTTAVGLYPRGASSQGPLDMAGNVWEWCLNKYDDPRKPSAIEVDASDAWRVLRGGAWGDGPGFLRSADRNGGTPDNWNFNVGFRLAQDIE